MNPDACETRIMTLILARLMKLEQDGASCHFWRHNVGAARDMSGRMIRFGSAGQADLLGLVRGRFVAIETKAADGRVTKDQREWGARITAAGGLYLVARCLEDAIDPVQELLSA